MPLTLPMRTAPLSRFLRTQSQSNVIQRATSPRLSHQQPFTSPKNAPKSPPTRTFSLASYTMAPVDPVDNKALQSNRAIVISGPSGAGKSTILKRLFDEYPDKFGFSISHTTRSPRGSEKDGVEYHFVTKDEFLKLVDDKGFIEHAKFGSNHYGTSIKAVNDIAEKGRTCVLDIEMEVCLFFSRFCNGTTTHDYAGRQASCKSPHLSSPTVPFPVPTLHRDP